MLPGRMPHSVGSNVIRYTRSMVAGIVRSKYKYKLRGLSHFY